LSPDFTLLALDADEPSISALQVSAEHRGVPLKVIRDSYAEGRERYEARLVLVRPDQYVVWAGDSAPSDTADLIARVSGNDQGPGRSATD
jgi:4-hydroxyisophthalate hydroxylase